jgi:hypothetical protein
MAACTDCDREGGHGKGGAGRTGGDVTTGRERAVGVGASREGGRTQ